MQHPKRTSARLASALTLAVLAIPVVLSGAVSEKASGEPMSLEALRQKVLANEAKTRRIRMTYTNIPDSNMENCRNPATANGTPASHLIYSYAQDGVRRHVTETAIGLDGRPISWHVEVTDGEVRKSSSQLDLMEGWITPPEKFSVSAPGPLWTAFNPFVDRLLLSECLAPEYASVCQDHATLGGRDATVVEIKHPDHKAVVKRAWIDRERGTAIRIEMRGVKTRGERPSFAEATKFHQLPNGGWFPVEGCVEGHLIRDGQEINLYNSWSVDINSISIDEKDFPDDLFDIRFPPGANVVTEIAPAPVETKIKSPNPPSRPSRPRRR